MTSVFWKALRPGAMAPERKTQGAAGFDLAACLEENILLPPGEVVFVPTGIALALPAGWEGEVRPRSGFSTKNRILIPNSPGTIDDDYRGEIFVPLLNLSGKPFALEPGQRIAQILFRKYETPNLEEVAQLDETERGEKGFGSTGEK